MRTDPELGIVEVLPVSGDFDRRAPLRLTLAHPALESADLPLLLQPTDTGWRTEAQVDVSHDWNVQLAPEMPIGACGPPAEGPAGHQPAPQAAGQSVRAMSAG